MSETAHVRYIFIDIVGFTRNRTVEAQSDLVATMNKLVSESVQLHASDAGEVIFLPTGDGMAIALLNASSWDVHLKLGLDIIRRVSETNSLASDDSRKFQIRVGINENFDNVVLDINNKRNVAGYGISMAQRIMNKADGSQVLLGQAVYEILKSREAYINCFRAFETTGKHGITFPVYQFVEESAGLNISTPSAFRKDEPGKFNRFVAYYVAHAACHREFLASRKGEYHRDEAAIVLFSFLAEDSVEKWKTPKHEDPSLVTWKADEASFEEQYRHYQGMDGWVLTRLSNVLSEKNLEPYSTYFESAMSYVYNYAFVKPSAIEKLRNEWPKIAKEFKLTNA